MRLGLWWETPACAAIAIAALLAQAVNLRAETCLASYYGAESGRRTANGERFNPMGLTVAMRSHDFGHRYRITYRGRSVVVRHNDFGPALWTGRCADLSHRAAQVLGLEARGFGPVSITRLP